MNIPPHPHSYPIDLEYLYHKSAPHFSKTHIEVLSISSVSFKDAIEDGIKHLHLAISTITQIWVKDLKVEIQYSSGIILAFHAILVASCKDAREISWSLHEK